MSSSTREKRSRSSAGRRRSRTTVRRFGLVAGGGHHRGHPGRDPARVRQDGLVSRPSAATLAGLSVPQRIVALAESQVGYSTDPSGSYCNKYSAHWDAGTARCPSSETAEEWCADFAAWAWQEAGVQFIYGYGPGEINGAAASFYEWGVANGEWHPATSGYVASPGDVAVYGLSLGRLPLGGARGDRHGRRGLQQGPDVVNGDGDRTGFSVVETGTDQAVADTGSGDAKLDGYVSPPPAHS